jgi:hypothetical protein
LFSKAGFLGADTWTKGIAEVAGRWLLEDWKWDRMFQPVPGHSSQGFSDSETELGLSDDLEGEAGAGLDGEVIHEREGYTLLSKGKS